VSSVIIKPRAAVPARGERCDYETKPHQTELDIPVVQAERDGLEASLCVVNKTYRFSGVPDRAAPSPVRVVFSYDRDNMIDVEAFDTQTGKYLEKSIIDFSLPDSSSLAGLSVALVLDTSGSMAGSPLSQLKSQVASVSEEMDGTGCRLGVVEFGYRVAVVCPLTEDLDRVRMDVNGLMAGGGTPMGQGIAETIRLMAGVPGEKVAILVSDGLPDSQSEARLQAERLKGLDVTLYTISIGTVGAAFLRGIGDSYTQIQSAGDLAGAIGNLLWGKQVQTQ